MYLLKIARGFSFRLLSLRDTGCAVLLRNFTLRDDLQAQFSNSQTIEKINVKLQLLQRPMITGVNLHACTSLRLAGEMNPLCVAMNKIIVNFPITRLQINRTRNLHIAHFSRTECGSGLRINERVGSHSGFSRRARTTLEQDENFSRAHKRQREPRRFLSYRRREGGRALTVPTAPSVTGRPGSRASVACEPRAGRIPRGPREKESVFPLSNRSAWDATDRKIGSIGPGAFYSIAYVTQRTNGGRGGLLVRPVLPRFVTIRPCGNVRSSRRQPRCAPISIRAPVLFSLYTITSQFAAKCPSNFLTARAAQHIAH